MAKIVTVKVRPYRPPEHFAIKDLDVRSGEWVVVPQEYGIEVGEVVSDPIHMELPEGSLPPFIERFASTEEIQLYFENLDQEKAAWRFCEERVQHHGLSMKLVRVERQFDGGKITFYYVAENRVDFRDLVKDLVRGLRTRVEMRQIGVRHEAKMVGGVGYCGREICCASFLRHFSPVSIRMVKAQNLPLNPSKISGICGRLLCCLAYEYDTYKELRADFPSLGRAIELDSGEGKVIRQNLLKGTITVLFQDGEEVEVPIGGDGEIEEDTAKEASQGNMETYRKHGKDATQEKKEDRKQEKKRTGKKVESSMPQKEKLKKMPKKRSKAGKKRTQDKGKQ